MKTALAVLGIAGGACFAFAAVPSAVRAMRTGRNPGVPASLAWLVFSGTVLVYSYLLVRFPFDWILTANYFVEGWSWGILLSFHYFPRRDTVNA